MGVNQKKSAFLISFLFAVFVPKPFVPNDPYFYKAQKMGYRARSAFKLLEILEKFPHFLPKSGAKICDLGAAPGSFLQVLQTKNPEILVGIDLQEIIPLLGVHAFVGDIFSEEIAQSLANFAPFDVITSDLAPKTSGQKDIDQWHSVELSYRVLELSERILKKKGNILLKIFVGEDFDEFYSLFKTRFETVKTFKPKACRDRSFETYLVGFGFQ